MKKCNLCEKTSIGSASVFGLKICSSCLDSICDLKIGDKKYEHYKRIIRDAYLDWAN